MGELVGDFCLQRFPALLGPADLVCTALPLGHVPLLERLEAIRLAGFRGISLSVQDILASRAVGIGAAELVARIAGAGLRVADVECVGNWLPEHAVSSGPYADVLAALTPELVVEVARDMGARGILVVEMLGAAATRESIVGSFRRICDLAAPSGQVVHLEGVAFGCVPDLRSAWAIVREADRSNAALTIDPWHLFRGGGSLDDLAQIPGDKIGCVQLSDGRLQGEGDPLVETTSARLLPGEGEFDLSGLVHALDAIGSTAPIGVEVFNRRQRDQPIAAIVQSWARATRGLLDEARSPS